MIANPLRSGTGGLAVLLVSLLLLPKQAGAAEPVRHQLRVAGAVQRVLAEDLDGDGRRELLVFSISGERETRRHVSVFAFRGNDLGPEASTSWDLDPEAGTFDMGYDAVDGPSLWYCTHSSVRRYRLRDAMSRAPSSELWLDQPSLLGGRSDEWVLFHDFVDDWSGTGNDTPALLQPGRILLPQLEAQAPAAVLEVRTEIDGPELPTNYDMSPHLPLLARHRAAALTRVDIDGDGRADLTAALGTRLEVHHGAKDGSFARHAGLVVDFPTAARTRDETRRQFLQLADVTGDGKVDAVISTITGGFGNLQHYLDIFPGSGSAFASKATTTLHTPGIASLTILDDIDGDGRAELTSISIAIGVRALLSYLLTSSVSVDYATYAVDDAGRLRDEPFLEWSQPVRLDPSGATDPGAATLAGDFDGDGIRDVVLARSGEEIEIRRVVRRDGRLAMGEVLERLRAAGQGQALARDLDGDGRSDLVVYAPRGPQGIVNVFMTPSAVRPPPQLRPAPQAR